MASEVKTDLRNLEVVSSELSEPSEAEDIADETPQLSATADSGTIGGFPDVAVNEDKGQYHWRTITPSVRLIYD